jgi:Amt family ammonium transporter
MPIPGYIFFSTVSIAWTYPIVVHWVWGNGFLGHMDFRDFSGAAVVHLAGGLSGLVATCFIGTRHNWKKTTTNFRPNNIVRNL